MLTANYILNVYKPQPKIRLRRAKLTGDALVTRDTGIINDLSNEPNLTTAKRFEIADKWGVSKAQLNNIWSASKRKLNK